MSLTGQLAEYFLNRPGEWIDGRQLAKVAGAYGWRSRCSDLRRAPFNLPIENRQKRLLRADGTTYVLSEYRLAQ